MRAWKTLICLLTTLIILLADSSIVPPVYAQMSPDVLAEKGTIKDWWASDAQSRLQAAAEIVKKATGTANSDAAAALEKCISDATLGNDSLKSSKIVEIALSCEGG